MILFSAVWDCDATGVKDDGEKNGELIRCKKTETVSRGRFRYLYTRVVTYIVKYERMYSLCRVRRGSLGVVCIVCMLPL